MNRITVEDSVFVLAQCKIVATATGRILVPQHELVVEIKALHASFPTGVMNDHVREIAFYGGVHEEVIKAATDNCIKQLRSDVEFKRRMGGTKWVAQLAGHSGTVVDFPIFLRREDANWDNLIKLLGIGPKSEINAVDAIIDRNRALIIEIDRAVERKESAKSMARFQEQVTLRA